MTRQKRTDSRENSESQAVELECVQNADFAMGTRIFLATFGAMFGKKRLGR